MGESQQFEHLLGLFEATQTELQNRAARTVDVALVVRNWLFGWYLSEFENGRISRNELYGKKLMEQLAQKLTVRLGKGFSRRSLDQYRLFYERFSPTEKIRQTLSAESLSLSNNALSRMASASGTKNPPSPHFPKGENSVATNPPPLKKGGRGDFLSGHLFCRGETGQ